MNVGVFKALKGFTLRFRVRELSSRNSGNTVNELYTLFSLLIDVFLLHVASYFVNDKKYITTTCVLKNTFMAITNITKYNLDCLKKKTWCYTSTEEKVLTIDPVIANSPEIDTLCFFHTLKAKVNINRKKKASN